MPIAIKVYLKHHWGGRKVALCFGPNRIRTLVAMATDSSHRVIIGGGEFVTPLAPSLLIVSSSFLQVTRTTIMSLRSSKFGQIRPESVE